MSAARPTGALSRAAGSRAFRWTAVVVCAVLAVYGLVYVDLVLRARSAYLEGEKYMEWHRRPEAKKAFFEARFLGEKEILDRRKAAGELVETEYRQRLELERFRRDEAVAESSLKYAYHWHKTAVELFSPPESRWVRASREKMAEAKELWKRELDGKNIPYEDYMLE
ncbi:MAG: hypothetical protein ABII00_10515 [Elusimicrobiota bacterium]